MNNILFSGYDYYHSAEFAVDSQSGNDFYLLVITLTPAEFMADGAMQKYPAHSAVLYPPHQPVRYGACGEGFGNDWIRFQSDEPFVANFSRMNEPFQVSDPEYCHNLIQIITWENAAQSSPAIISQLLHVLFYKLEDDILNHESSSHDYELLMLRKNIMNNPQLEWNVADMAEQLHISMGYLQNLYKKKFGISCVDNVIASRIRMAKDLLVNTNLSVCEISNQCGYHNVEHFCRQFRKETGMTPREYRRGEL